MEQYITEDTKWKIYALSDPRTPDYIRYVGITINTLKQRLQGHLSDARGGMLSYKCHWIRSVLGSNLRPLITEIYDGVGLQWQECERLWIKHYREIFGDKLTNHGDGGEGLNRQKLSQSALDKIRQANIGRKNSDETRRKISIGNAGKIQPRDAVEKTAAATRGRKATTQEEFNNRSAAQKGRKKSPEHIAKLMDGLAKYKAIPGNKVGRKPQPPKEKIKKEKVKHVYTEKEKHNLSTKLKEYYSTNPHPRANGMTEETRKKISETKLRQSAERKAAKAAALAAQA